MYDTIHFWENLSDIWGFSTLIWTMSPQREITPRFYLDDILSVDFHWNVYV